MGTVAGANVRIRCWVLKQCYTQMVLFVVYGVVAVEYLDAVSK
jgi:hypothetical protein